MEIVPNMDYISGPTSQWRGIYTISTKIGINTWQYLKSENALKMRYSNPNSYYTSGFVVRNREKMTINSSNFVTVTSRPLLSSLPQNASHNSHTDL
jgi:hypothetical protein